MTYSELHLVAETKRFHINNVEMFGYLEQARRIWYELCKKHGVEGVIVHVEADFKKEIFNQEKINIRTWLERIGNTSFTLKQTVVNEQDDLIVSATTVIATINSDTRTKTPVPDEIRELLHKETVLV